MTDPPIVILLIGDSPPSTRLLRVALEAEGYSVLEAADGREGVRRLRAAARG